APRRYPHSLPTRRSSDLLAGVKLILYVEHTVDVTDLPSALWRFCNNLDPRRDSVLARRNVGGSFYSACMGFDGTLKTKEHDDFRSEEHTSELQSRENLVC